MSKKCSQCGEWKPITEYRFLPKQARFMSECKACERDRRRLMPSRKENRELAVDIVVKLCKRHGTGILSAAVDRLVTGE